MRKKNDLLSSFNSAFRGLIYILKRERNFRIHVGIGTAVIVGSLFLNLSLSEFLILVLTVSMVLMCETVNTLIEMLIDAFFPEYSDTAKRIKDTGACLVLLSAITSVIIGYLILSKRFPPEARNAFENIAHSPWYITFIALLLVTTLTIILKFIIKKESLLTGGMPSIHSGISFSIWTIVSFLTFKHEPLISLLVFLLAFWVAQSRVMKKIHNVEEVIIGGVTGILFTILIFQIFWGLK